jgi:hypothetical protein
MIGLLKGTRVPPCFVLLTGSHVGRLLGELQCGGDGSRATRHRQLHPRTRRPTSARTHMWNGARAREIRTGLDAEAEFLAPSPGADQIACDEAKFE